MSKVKVSNVEIVIGDQTIKLSLDEARELLQVLEATIAPKEKEVKYVPLPYSVDRYPRPYQWGPYWSVTYLNVASDIPMYTSGNTLQITAQSGSQKG